MEEDLSEVCLTPAELGPWNAGGQQGCLHLLGWGRGGSPKWRKVFWGSLSQSGPNGTKVDPRPFAGFEFRPAPLLQSVRVPVSPCRSAVSTDTVAEGGQPQTVLVTPVAPGRRCFWVLLTSLPPVRLRVSHLAAMGLPSPQCHQRCSHLLLRSWE